MRRGLGAVLFTALVLAVGAGGGGVAWANHTDPNNIDGPYARVAPFYDITSGKTAIVLASTPSPGTSSTSAIALGQGRMWFYDATCVRKFDLPFKPTPNDVSIFNLVTIGGLPTQGAILFGTSSNNLTPTGAFPAFANVTVETIQVDFVTDHVWLQTAGRNNATANWTPYDQINYVPVVAADNGTSGFSTFYFSCPIRDLGFDMNLMDTNPPVSQTAEPFPSGTTAQAIDILVYNVDEGAIASIHNISCTCVTVSRASALFGGAATQDTHWQFFKVATSGSGGLVTNETQRVDYTVEIHAGAVNVLFSGRAFRDPDSSTQ